MNNVTLIGNLTRAPESTAVGETTVTKFSVAVNKKIKKQNGETKELVVFPDIEVWGRVAENCAKYLDKGSKVAIIGELTQSSWENEQGEKRTKLFVKASSVEFLSTQNSGSEQEQEKTTSSSSSSNKSKQDNFDDDFDDDVPF